MTDVLVIIDEIFHLFKKGNNEKKGYNLIKWDSLTHSKKARRFGHNIYQFPKQMSASKMDMEIQQQRFSSVGKIHHPKVCLMNQWITKDVLSTNVCSVRKTIRKLWQSMA